MIGNGIRQDNTWLVVDPIVGCSNNCQYCFLQLYNKTNQKGEITMSPTEAINKLMNYWAFQENSMVMIGSETDMFMNSKNVEYLSKFVKLYNKKGIKNPLSICTKCYIPDIFIELVKTLTETEFIFYISYSGLTNDIEPHINKQKVKSNFQRLNNANQKIIHLWRPMIPQNSTLEVLEKVFNDIEGASCSVLRGLNLNEKLQERIWFWPEAQQAEIDFSKVVSLWPEELSENLKKTSAEKPNYPIFFKNSCAMSYVLGQPDFVGIYNSERCIKCNCPPSQRHICFTDSKNCNEIYDNKISSELKKIGLNNQFFYNKKDSFIRIKGIMSHEQIAYLTQVLRKKLIVENIDSKHEWGGYVLGHSDKRL